MPDVFISYARGDRKRVRPIAKALAAEGFDVWWDQSSSQDGAWTPQLRRALVDSAAILACWSQEATKSSWVAAEATHANDRKALVGAVLEACKIPAPFNAVESADLMKWRGDQDAPAWRNIVRQLRQLIRVRDGDIADPEEDEAPPHAQRAPAAPAQQAAQVVAPTAFFSQSLGRPQQAQARAAQPQSPQRAFQPIDAPPPPPKPPPRVVLPPMDPPPPTPRPRTVEQRRPAQPVDEPPPPRAFAPEKRSPVRPVDEPTDKRRPPRPAEEARQRAAPPPPQPRSFQPIDEPPPRQSRQSDRDRRAAPPPPRPYTPVDEAPPRRKGGFAQFVLLGAVAAAIVAGVVWGGQRFLSAPSAPKLAQDREASAAPEPLPTEGTAEAQTDDIPSAEDLLRAEVEQAPLEPPPALAKAPPPTAAADRPSQTAPQPAVRPPAQQQKLPTAPAQQATTRPAKQPTLALRPTTQPTDSTTPPRPPPPTRTASAQPTTQPRTPPSTAPATQPSTRTAGAQPTTQPRTPPATAPTTQPSTRTAGAQPTTQPRTPPATAPTTQPSTRTAGAQPTTQPRTPPSAAPTTAPANNTGIRQTAAVTPAPGPTPANADATRELERCLGRLVRMCPSGGGGRPGFAEDGALSASERALLNQRSLFAWSDALSSNVANCSRHLNAAGQAGQTPYQPLATACRGLPTSGPPR